MKSRPDSVTAVAILGALAQESRLGVFRALVKAGRTGLAAGRIAQDLDIPASSLSFHLSNLKRAGLVIEQREGRSIIYRADFQTMYGLMGFMLENCCSEENSTVEYISAITQGTNP